MKRLFTNWWFVSSLIVITLDKDGAYLATREGAERRVTTRQRQVAVRPGVQQHPAVNLHAELLEVVPLSDVHGMNGDYKIIGHGGKVLIGPVALVLEGCLILRQLRTEFSHLTGDNRTVIKGFIGQSRWNSADTLADQENPVGLAQLRYQFLPCTATRLTGCDLNGNRLVDSPAELGAFQLGGHAVVLAPGKDAWPIEFELGTVMDGEAEEHIAEVAKVLSRYVDLIAVRAFPKFQDWSVDREDRVLRAFQRPLAGVRVLVVGQKSGVVHGIDPEDGRVLLHLDGNQKVARVIVSDNGPGMSKEAVAKAFDSFAQHGISRSGERALGLGMPLAKQFVEAHGGTVTVESAVGVGTTFRVELPVRQMKLVG